jgi:hypothetical protein
MPDPKSRHPKNCDLYTASRTPMILGRYFSLIFVGFLTGHKIYFFVLFLCWVSMTTAPDCPYWSLFAIFYLVVSPIIGVFALLGFVVNVKRGSFKTEIKKTSNVVLNLIFVGEMGKIIIEI